MRRTVLFCLNSLAVCFLLSSAVLAGNRNPADFPLRVHIFQHNGYSHYYRPTRTLDDVDGEGRANLYENGEPRGFDFGYRCADRMLNSAGYETYMARWRKRDSTLQILLPVMGKPGAMESCDLKVNMKDSAYYRHKGEIDEEPAAVFKAWMEKHQYDPEHGKNEPVRPAAGPAGAGPAESQ